MNQVRRPFQVTEQMTKEMEEDIAKFAAKPQQEQPRLPLLVEREHTHGLFHDNAALSQALKTSFRTMPNWKLLEPEHREVIDLICTKFGRIMTGDPMHEEHWKDITGYAELAREICK